jgi:hypothetical protein
MPRSPRRWCRDRDPAQGRRDRSSQHNRGRDRGQREADRNINITDEPPAPPSFASLMGAGRKCDHPGAGRRPAPTKPVGRAFHESVGAGLPHESGGRPSHESAGAEPDESVKGPSGPPQNSGAIRQRSRPGAQDCEGTQRRYFNSMNGHLRRVTDILGFLGRRRRAGKAGGAEGQEGRENRVTPARPHQPWRRHLSGRCNRSRRKSP